MAPTFKEPPGTVSFTSASFYRCWCQGHSGFRICSYMFTWWLCDFLLCDLGLPFLFLWNGAIKVCTSGLNDFKPRAWDRAIPLVVSSWLFLAIITTIALTITFILKFVFLFSSYKGSLLMPFNPSHLIPGPHTEGGAVAFGFFFILTAVGPQNDVTHTSNAFLSLNGCC